MRPIRFAHFVVLLAGLHSGSACADYLYYGDKSGRDVAVNAVDASGSRKPSGKAVGNAGADANCDGAGIVGTVNINQADADLLSTRLKGVGKAKAEAIIAWREANGPFRSLADLDKVKGIGPSIIQRNQDAIRFQ